MAILTVAEVKGDSLKKVSKEMIVAASSLNDTVVTLLIGGSNSLSEELSKAGADVVIHNSSVEFSPEGYANIISSVAEQHGVGLILMAHSLMSRDCAGRVAVQRGSSLVADVVSLSGRIDELIVKKPVYSGKAIATMKVKGSAVLTLRPNSFALSNSSKSNGKIESASFDEGTVKARIGGYDFTAGNKIQLNDSSIIVAGGRGVKGTEGMQLLQELCDILNAALGASRAAVDAGWISHSHQVGQTGKTVSPDLYIACGISGSIQHLAGMSSSRCIVAVNKDSDAPIFKVASYGLVDDLFEVVPELILVFQQM